MAKPDTPPIQEDEAVLDGELIADLWKYDEQLVLGLSDHAKGPASKAGLTPEVSSRLLQDQAMIRLLLDTAAVTFPHLAASTPNGEPLRGPAVDLADPSGVEAETPILSDGEGIGGLPKSFGRFELVRELGRGGLGVVLLAHDPILRRYVALKIPRPEALLTPDLRVRFLREAQAAARLTHPNIVTIYEVGQIGAVNYIAAAYCEGTDLATWIHAQSAKISSKQAAQVVALLADGIGYAHRQGVLHRDLKPSNVLLETRVQMQTDSATKGDASWMPKISDFGLARIQDTKCTETRAGLVMGTPNYMAPEQANGSTSEIGDQTDIYGLGTILYELLTGRPPFQGSCDADTLRQVVNSEPTRPRAIRPELPRDLEAICCKCLEKKPHARYASADELAVDLRRYLAGEPTRARPLSSLRRLAKWSYRRPALAALMVTSGLLAASIVGGSALYSLELSHALAESEARRVQAEEHERETEQQRQLIAQSNREIARERDANAELLYGAQMHLGYQSLARGYIKQVNRLLADYEEGTPWSHLRGFEWRYLKQLLHGERLTLRGHQGEVYGVRYSPDGRTLLTGGEDGTIKLWDSKSGQELRSIKAHSACTNDLAFSPDGRLLASASCDRTVKLWDTGSWQLVTTFPCGPGAIMSCVEFSPNGRQLVAGDTQSGVLTVWDVATTEQVQLIDTVTPSKGGGLNDVEWSPDGQQLATACLIDAQIWNVSNWQRTMTWEPRTRSIAFSPDGLLIFSHGSFNQSFMITNTATGESHQFPSGIGGQAFKVVVSPDGKNLCVSDELVIRVWTLGADGFPIRGSTPRMLIGHEGRVQNMALSPDGQTLASASFDGTVRLWDLTSREEVPIFRSRTRASVFAPELDRVIVLAEDQQLVTWDLSTPKPAIVAEQPVTKVDERHYDLFSSDGQVLANYSKNSLRFCRLNASQGTLEFTTLPWKPGIAARPVLSSDGSMAAVLLRDGMVRVWNMQAGTELYAAQQPIDKESLARGWNGAVLSFSDDNRHLAISNGSNVIVDLENGKEIKFESGGEHIAVCCSRFSPAGRLLVNAHLDGAIDLIDTSTGQILRTLRTSSSVSKIAFTPDGRTVAAGVDDGRVLLLHVATGQESGTLTTRTGKFEELRFSRDGLTLGAIAQGSSDSSETAVYIWSCGTPPSHADD